MTRERAEQAGLTLEYVRAALTSWPNDARFDLLLDSGLLHNLGREDIPDYRRKIIAWLKPEGHFVLAHWESRSDHDRLRGGARRASRRQIIELFEPELTEYRFERLEATGLPERIVPDLSVGFYWFRYPTA